MDNVTHSLVGLMMARVSGRNAAMMVVAANMPDIDVVSWAGGTLTYLDYHRGFAHSLLAAPFWALALIFVFQSANVRSYAACLAGVLSHLMLDWTNTYGIRLLSPFSGRWLHLDMTDVVDPWILLVLLLAVAAPWLAGLVGSEIGSKKSSGAKTGWAWVALSLLLAYESGRFVAHQRVIAMLSARMWNGQTANRLSAIPNRSNPLRWRGVAEGDGYAVNVPVDLNAEIGSGRVSYSAPVNEAAIKTRAFQVLSRFDQLPFWTSQKLGDGTTEVKLLDLRFGTPDQPGFSATAILDGSTVKESKFGFGPLPVGK